MSTFAFVQNNPDDTTSRLVQSDSLRSKLSSRQRKANEMSELKPTATDKDYLQSVEEQLSRYEHPLFEWSARQASSGVEVIITLKVAGIYDQPYRLMFRPREIEARGFQWEFQRQLYNCLHDYLVEMFTRSPHIAEI